MRILITGGAGFVGSSLSILWKKTDPSVEITVIDNLRRRGSESNIARLSSHNIAFAHGDIRHPSDLNDLEGNFDLVIGASAEPSVLAGYNSSPRYVLDTNLMGTINCLEFARARAGAMIFLSTSRVYSIAPLRKLPLKEGAHRFDISEIRPEKGYSPEGINERFATEGFRSFYGATKLSSELLIQEYVHTYQMKAVINRCGVICGPGQFGKVDQGIFSMWLMAHANKTPLCYTGFGGTGKQVRDMLHPNDLFELIRLESQKISSLSGSIFNVGGGRVQSVSLQEWTETCRKVTGNETTITTKPDTNLIDIPYYVSDNAKVRNATGWSPKLSPLQVAKDIFEWNRKAKDSASKSTAKRAA